MRKFAYCAKSFLKGTRKAAGIEPFVCPPIDSKSVDLEAMKEADFLYFDLHGIPGSNCWYGDNATVALSAQQVIDLGDLSGKIVFSASCFMDETNPMLMAWIQTNAIVIGGPDMNFGPQNNPNYGAQLLGLWIRRGLEFGLEIKAAYDFAKLRVKLSGIGKSQAIKAATQDTLGFVMYNRKRDKTA